MFVQRIISNNDNYQTKQQCNKGKKAFISTLEQASLGLSSKVASNKATSAIRGKKLSPPR